MHAEREDLKAPTAQVKYAANLAQERIRNLEAANASQKTEILELKAQVSRLTLDAHLAQIRIARLEQALSKVMEHSGSIANIVQSSLVPVSHGTGPAGSGHAPVRGGAEPTHMSSDSYVFSPLDKSLGAKSNVVKPDNMSQWERRGSSPTTILRHHSRLMWLT